jgi:hypothetical protein
MSIYDDSVAHCNRAIGCHIQTTARIIAHLKD